MKNLITIFGILFIMVIPTMGVERYSGNVAYVKIYESGSTSESITYFQIEGVNVQAPLNGTISHCTLPHPSFVGRNDLVLFSFSNSEKGLLSTILTASTTGKEISIEVFQNSEFEGTCKVRYIGFK